MIFVCYAKDTKNHYKTTKNHSKLKKLSGFSIKLKFFLRFIVLIFFCSFYCFFHYYLTSVVHFSFKPMRSMVKVHFS